MTLDFKICKDDLRYTKRQNVTLLPCLNLPHSGTSAYGFIGAYEDKTPIPESLRLTMGWQLHLFSPYQEADDYIDETVIYAGMPNSGYGHFLLDAMARLWYAKDHPDIPILWDWPALPSLAAPILELVGIKNKHLFLDRPTRFKEVIFPFPGCAIGDFFLKGQEGFLGVFNGSEPISGKKIYLSRKNIKNGPVLNEEAIEGLVKSYGFQVYYPEQHTILEQLEEIATSSIVLGVEGSALHSVVLLKTPIHTRFYALARHRRGGGVFEHIRLQKDIQYTTLNLLREDKHLAANSEVDINIELLERVLSETKGLEEEMPLGEYTVSVKAPQVDYLEVINKFKVSLTEAELTAYGVLQSLFKKGESSIVSQLAPLFQAVRVSDERDTIVNNIPSFTQWRNFVEESLSSSGARKPKEFIDVYSEILYGRNIGAMLEIGVYQGNSIRFFRNLLGDTAKIFAVDIKKECADLVDKGADAIFIGSQVDEKFMLDICQNHGPFDLIIDDGSHQSAHMLKTLDVMFPHLKPGGLYVIEDMHTTYWDHYGGKLKGNGTFMEVTKERLDKLFLRYMVPRYREEYGYHTLNPGDLPAEDAISPLLDSIRVYRAGIAVFKKIT